MRNNDISSPLSVALKLLFFSLEEVFQKLCPLCTLDIVKPKPVLFRIEPKEMHEHQQLAFYSPTPSDSLSVFWGRLQGAVVGW